MLFFASLLIAVASILATQVAHRRARSRVAETPSTSRWANSPVLLLAPVALVVFGLLLVGAIGVSRGVAAVFFVAAFLTALVWTVRTSRPRHP
jgi:hypothetical protein